MRDLPVERDIEYRRTDGGPLTFDVYRPRIGSGERVPAVVLVTGYSDIGAAKLFGCRFNQMQSAISWARLMAASGMAAITFATGKEPAADARALFAHVRDRADQLGIDAGRIGLWACSGHGANAAGLLIGAGSAAACAAFLYAFTLDLDGATDVADASRTFGFANPAAGKSADDLPSGVPILLVRAGADQFGGANAAMDRLTLKALARDLPITLVNHAGAPHAFDLDDNSDATKRVIADVLWFLRACLRVPTTLETSG
jgi:hypothetical protein